MSIAKIENLPYEEFYKIYSNQFLRESYFTKEVSDFFIATINQIPKIAIGTHYWQIFDNGKPIPKIISVGGDVEKMLPTTAQEILTYPPEKIFSYFLPEDLTKAFAFINKIFEILTTTEIDKRKNYNFTFYARIKNDENKYAWNCIQYPAVYFDENGQFTFGLVLYSNVDHLIKGNFEPILTIIDFADSKSLQFSCYDSNIQKKSIDYPKISQREKEVIALLSQGKASKQIADILGISKNTVDNHRQRLLKKFDAKSSSELIVEYLNMK